MKKLLLFFAAISFVIVAKATNPGCAGAVNLNQTSNFGPISDPEDTSIDYGCVIPNAQLDFWYGYFTVCQGGTCSFQISNMGPDSVGIVVWGPFSTTNGICQNLTNANIVACAPLTPSINSISLGNVQTGEIYMVAYISDSAWAYGNFQPSGTAVITGNCPPPPGPGCAIGAVDLNQYPFSGYGSLEDTTIDYGCVTAAGQYMWYGYFSVCQGGSLTVGGACNSSVDADITVWGPFSNTTALCSQLTTANIAGCGASAGTDYVNLGNVSYGQVYMVAVACDTSTQIPYFLSSGSADITGTCVPPPPCAPINGYEMLCLVTVDSATQEYQLVWNEIPGNPVSYFGIMKNDYLNVPQQIDTVQITSLSQYIDISADPNIHTETYSIIVYDTCGTSWTNGGYSITPVFCQSSLSTQGTVNVAWSSYIDNSMNGPAYYVIYRGSTPANMVSLDTVSYTTNMWTDINPLSGTAYYKIGVALYAPCVPMRLQYNAQTNYYVQSFSNASPVTVVGIGENSLQEVSLFPNPSDGNLTIRNVGPNSVLRVYDVTGRMVTEQDLLPGTQNVSLVKLDAGLYSVTIENETGFFRDEIVIRQ